MQVEQRTQHPFYMYEAILGQPDAIAYTAERNQSVIDQLSEYIASSQRLFLVGIGTSYHAAQVGEHFMRVYGGGLPTYSYHSFDFALYGSRLTPQDCVIAISHRGNKRYTLESLKAASEAGCYTVLITGEGEAEIAASADGVLRTVEQDKSAAHTISYVGTLAVLAALAERIGYHRTAEQLLPTDFLQAQLPTILREALASERYMIQLTREHIHRRRFWVVGGGPSAITAQEIALKIKETSYCQAEGMSIEAMLHGPFQCAEAADLFILIAPAGAAQERTLELAAMVKAIQAAYLVISDGIESSLQLDSAGWYSVPPVPEPFTSLTCLIPLQLFAYYLALKRGTNPDGFRLDDPRFEQARKLIQL